MTLKSQIWQKLCLLEKRVHKEINFKDNIDLGHEALKILNKILKQPENKKLKEYSDNLLDEAEKIIYSNTFYEKLKTTRSEYLKNKKSMKKSKKLIQSNEIDELWDQLEDMGIEVHDLSYMGNGIIGFKISTPLRTYLDYTDDKQELTDLAKEDIEINNDAKCIFCNAPINYLEINNSYYNKCKNCGSLYNSIPSNFGEYLVDYISKKYGMDGIIYALNNWKELFFIDYKTNYYWFEINKVKEKSIDHSIFKNIKCVLPDLKNPTIINMPIFIWEDEELEEGYDNAIYPSCEYCKYGVEFRDEIQCAECYCSYPIESKEIYNFLKFDLEYKPDYHNNYYYDNDGEAEIWNLFIKKIITLFIEINNQERFEGKINNKFISPICENFINNELQFDIECGNIKKCGTINVEFGVPNLERIQRKKEGEEVERLENIFVKLKKTEKYKSIFKKRIECNENFRIDRKPLMDTIVELFSLEEITLMNKHYYNFCKYLNLSNHLETKLFKDILNKFNE